MDLRWKWTIPNVLSLIRIALVPVFAVLYLLGEQNPTLFFWAIGVLVLSGVTDLFDGMIARKFNQITEIGKLLDPVADKLTQVTVVVCLAVRVPRLWPLVVLCAAKELMQTIGAGLLLLFSKQRVQAAEWYGKVSTFVFYFCVAMFVAFPVVGEEPFLFGWNMPEWLFFTLAVAVAVCMAFALVQYAILFIKVMRRESDDKKQERP